MLKENKGKIILSSIIILLPILFGLIMWDTLPDTVATHWGPDGNADRFSGKAFGVFGLPVIPLIGHLVCLFCISLDKRQKDQNKKALGVIFWIIPVVSLLVNGFFYAAALGKVFSVGLLTPVILGILFIFIGNYLPKTKQNSALGIKFSWTLRNEENWNKTHRITGKVWVLGGLIMIFSIFLPPVAMVSVVVCVVLAMMLVPVVYSYSIYKKHQKEGVKYVAPPKSKAEKIAVIISLILVPVILIGVAVLMFTGDIAVHWEDTAFQINADYYADSQVSYGEIDSISYRKELDTGFRTSGFYSARLSMGAYQNDEFGSYTLYAYNGAQAFVVLTSGDKTLVIGMKEPQETQEIYETLLEKTGK